MEKRKPLFVEILFYVAAFGIFETLIKDLGITQHIHKYLFYIFVAIIAFILS